MVSQYKGRPREIKKRFRKQLNTQLKSTTGNRFKVKRFLQIWVFMTLNTKKQYFNLRSFMTPKYD